MPNQKTGQPAERLNYLLDGCKYLSEEKKQAYRDKFAKKGQVTEADLDEIAMADVDTLIAIRKRERQ